MLCGLSHLLKASSYVCLSLLHLNKPARTSDYETFSETFPNFVTARKPWRIPEHSNFGQTFQTLAQTLYALERREVAGSVKL